MSPVFIGTLLAGLLSAAPKFAAPDFSSKKEWSGPELARLLYQCVERADLESVEFWRGRLTDDSAVRTEKPLAKNLQVKDLAATCLLKAGIVPLEKWRTKEIVSFCLTPKCPSEEPVWRVMVADARDIPLPLAGAEVERWKEKRLKEADEASGVPMLRDIKHLPSKGRAQDADLESVDPLVARLSRMGRDAVPFLIGELVNPESMPPGVVPLWNDARVGDVALFLLLDFFTDRAGTPTVSGVDFDSIVGTKPDGSSAESRLAAYVEKNGRGALQRKWKELWGDGTKFVWDADCLCAKPRCARTLTPAGTK